MPRTRSQAGSSISEQSGEPADQLRRAQEVYATFELFKPNRWLTATDGVAGVQMINFNRLREFCSSVISRDPSIYDNFVHMKDRWDDSLLALIRTFQHAAAALNKYRAGKMDAGSCANTLQHITGKIRNNRHNSPLELEPDQRNPHLATEIVLFIIDEVLEAALMKRLAAEEEQADYQPEALYGLLIGRYAAQQSIPELYRDLLNLPSHFLPRHEARMRRVIDKQRRMSDQYINENILTTLRSKIPTSEMAAVGGSIQGDAGIPDLDESEDYEDESEEEDKEEEDSDDDEEEGDEDEDDDDEEMEYSAEE